MLAGRGVLKDLDYRKQSFLVSLHPAHVLVRRLETARVQLCRCGCLQQLGHELTRRLPFNLAQSWQHVQQQRQSGQALCWHWWGEWMVDKVAAELDPQAEASTCLSYSCTQATDHQPACMLSPAGQQH